MSWFILNSHHAQPFTHMATALFRCVELTLMRYPIRWSSIKAHLKRRRIIWKCVFLHFGPRY